MFWYWYFWYWKYKGHFDDFLFFFFLHKIWIRFDNYSYCFMFSLSISVLQNFNDGKRRTIQNDTGTGPFFDLYFMFNFVSILIFKIWSWFYFSRSDLDLLWIHILLKIVSIRWSNKDYMLQCIFVLTSFDWYIARPNVLSQSDCA